MKKINFNTVPKFKIRMTYMPFMDNKSLGKYRPAVILHQGKYMSKVMGITSRYHGKDTWIKEYLFVIHDWREKHLDRPSYVDVAYIRQIPNNCFIPLSVTTRYLPLSHKESYCLLLKRKFYVRARNHYDRTHTYQAHWLKIKYSKRYNAFNYAKSKHKNSKILKEFD